MPNTPTTLGGWIRRYGNLALAVAMLGLAAWSFIDGDTFKGVAWLALSICSGALCAFRARTFDTPGAPAP